MRNTFTKLRQTDLRRRVLRCEAQGFTLTELLVILAILGILTAIVVTAVFGAVPASARAACEGNFKTVEGAAETFKAQIGTYPVQLTDLTSQMVGLDGKLDGPWLRDIPDTYSSGPSPSVTDHASYGLAIDSATESIAVGTIKNNGALSDSGTPLNDGATNCKNA